VRFGFVLPLQSTFQCDKNYAVTENKIIFFSPAFDILCRVTLTADNNDGRKCRARMSAVSVGSCVAGFTLDIEHCYLRAIHVLIITKFAASSNHQYQPCSCPTTVLWCTLPSCFTPPWSYCLHGFAIHHLAFLSTTNLAANAYSFS